MLDDRKLAVLRAIVEDYVATQEPVGSKALVERHSLGVSPATVRNDMAALEEEGFIAQPHTSAGRVPTDKGYRLFVDRLTTVKPLSAAERRAITTFLDGAVDVDDVVQRSVRLLAQMTRQVAIVQYPTLTRVDRAPRRAGRADADPAAAGADHQHRPGRAAGGRAARRRCPSDVIADLRARLNTAAVGQRPSADGGRPRWRAVPARARPPAVIAGGRGRAGRGDRPTTAPTSGCWSAARPTWRASATTSTLAIRPLLEALEEHVVLLQLLGEATSRTP